MYRLLTTALICAAAQAATLNVNISITSTVAVTSSAFTATGTATLTGGITDNGTFSASVPLTALTGGGTTANANFTLGLSKGVMAGTLVIPLAVLEGEATSGSGSATITSATGSYAGDSGSFPSLAGTGGVGTSGISLDFSGAGTINTGGTVTAPPPSITAVLDAGSNTANLAPGTIFIVKGTNLCPGTTLTAYNVPRPTTATDGVQIVFTPAAGGTGTNALIWYEDPLGSGTCQLAGILPSTVAPGNYNVTVVNGTTSAGFATTVVATKFEMFTQDSTGTGLVSAQINGSYQLIRLTTGTLSGLAISPAHPGDNVVVYGTGMGAAPTGDDNAASPDYNYLTNGYSVQVLVGGVAATVQYAGLAGYAGEIQLNFALPSNVPTGCAVTLQVIVNNVMSVPVTLAIAPSASATACVEPGYTTAQLQALDNGGTIAAGSFGITQFAENVPGEGNIKLDEASGGFTEITGFQLGALPATVSTITQGACEVITGTSTNGVVTASGTVKNLDAGTVTLSGPSGTNLNKTALTETSDTYSLTIGDEGINIPGGLNGSIVAGTYTLAGAGGADVESFSNVQLTLGTPLTITGSLPTTIVRSQPLTISWTGGSSSNPVEISGSSSSTSGSVTTSTEFVCSTTAGAGSFTVPASILEQLPATPSATAGGSGSIAVGTGPAPVSFSPTLTAGGTIASTFSAFIYTAGSAIYQ